MRLGQIGFQNCKLILQLLFLCAQLFQLIGTGKNAGFLIYSTTGHGTTGVFHLTIQSNDTETVCILTRHGNGIIDVANHNCLAQAVFHNTAVFFVKAYQFRCNADKTTASVQPFLSNRLSLLHRDRIKRSTANTCSLQIVHAGLCILFGIHNHILHSRTQSSFNSQRVLILCANKTGYGAMHITQAAPLSLLHNGTNRLLIAFKIPLHGTEHTQLCLHTVQLSGMNTHLLCQLITALGTGGGTHSITGNGIVCRSDLFLGSTQLLAALGQGIGSLLLTACAGSQIAFQLLDALRALLQAFLQTADVGLTAGKVCGQIGFLGAQLQELALHTLCAGGHGSQLLLQLLDLRLLFLHFPFNAVDAGAGLLHLGSNTAAAVFLTLELFLNAGDVLQIVFHIAPQHGHLTVQLLVGRLQHVHLQSGGFQIAVTGAQCLAHLLRLLVEAVQLVVSLLQHKRSGGIILLCFLRGSRQLVQRIQPHGDLHALQFFLQLQELLGLFRLDLQRLQLQFQLGDLVADTQQVVLGVRQLTLGLLLAVTVLGNTGSLFEDLTAICALEGKDLVDTTLTDVGVTLTTQTGVHEHFMDVTQTGGLLVDIKFAVATAVVTTGDHNLVSIIGQSAVGVIQGQRCLRKADSRTLLRTAEDNVLHLCATEGLGALLAHDPKDRIGDIGFAGAVGADDGGDIIAKADQRLIREGLKALYFQAF